MKYIISGTNRPRSRTLQISKILQKYYELEGEKVEIIDLAEISFKEVDGNQYADAPPDMKLKLDMILKASGLIIVCPEYNGSYPGILKYFIDHWPYPTAFEYRPVCFVGLGARFGGLRAVEHLQGVFGYRNSFVFPERVFLSNIFQTLKEGKLIDAIAEQLLVQQVQGFTKFVKALKDAGLSAEARALETKPK